MIDQERLSSPQDAVEGLFALLSAHSGARSSGKAISTGLTGRVETLTDSEMMLLAAALSSKYSEALNQIWQRTDTDATKVSEEDWALANELAYQAIRAGLEGDEVARTVERVMRKGPYRSKWDEPRNGVTWLAQDIANAVQTVMDRLKRYKEKYPDLPAGWVANGTVSSGDIGGDSRVNGAAPGKPVGSVLPWPEPARVLGLPAAPVLNLSLFPPEIANVALDAAERLQAPPDYLAWGQTVTVAGLIGRRAGIRPRQRDDWTERACMWVVKIGPPSWMKSPAIEEARRPLRRQETLDRAAYEDALADWEAECDAIRAATPKKQKPKLPDPPAETRRGTSDATIEKLAELIAPSPGLTLVRDEVSGLVGSFNRYAKGEGDRQFWLECYSGGAYTVDRVGRGTVRVADLYLNLLGGTQPDKARELFGEGPDDGFAARVTGIYPEMPPDWEEHDRWPDRDARRTLDAVCDRLVCANWSTLLMVDEWKPLPYVRLHPEAGPLWSEWHRGLMARLRGGEWEGRHAGRVGKYPGLAVRLALIWHLIDWAAGRVSDDEIRLVPEMTLARVLDLMDSYVMPMDARVYRAFDRTSAANGGERIARWIEGAVPSSFTLRDIRRHAWSGLTEPDAIAAAVEWLAAMGWVREADPEQRPGRPANRYDVNPRIWKTDDVTER